MRASLKFHSPKRKMSLTTGNPNLDEFMQSYLSFMTNLSERMDVLTEAFTELAKSIDEANSAPKAFCSCMGNDVDVMNK